MDFFTSQSDTRSLPPRKNSMKMEATEQHQKSENRTEIRFVV